MDSACTRAHFVSGTTSDRGISAGFEEREEKDKTAGSEQTQPAIEENYGS